MQEARRFGSPCANWTPTARARCGISAFTLLCRLGVMLGCEQRFAAAAADEKKWGCGKRYLWCRFSGVVDVACCPPSCVCVGCGGAGAIWSRASDSASEVECERSPLPLPRTPPPLLPLLPPRKKDARTERSRSRSPDGVMARECEPESCEWKSRSPTRANRASAERFAFSNGFSSPGIKSSSLFAEDTRCPFLCCFDFVLASPCVSASASAVNSGAFRSGLEFGACMLAARLWSSSLTICRSSWRSSRSLTRFGSRPICVRRSAAMLSIVRRITGKSDNTRWKSSRVSEYRLQ